MFHEGEGPRRSVYHVVAVPRVDIGWKPTSRAVVRVQDRGDRPKAETREGCQGRCSLAVRLDRAEGRRCRIKRSTPNDGTESFVRTECSPVTILDFRTWLHGSEWHSLAAAASSYQGL
jgi:hypothetical protein